MVPADSRRISRDPRYSGFRLASFHFAYRTFTVYGTIFQWLLLTKLHAVIDDPTTPPWPEPRRFGLFPGRSPLLGESLLFSLPTGTKMFQFPAFASAYNADNRITSAGLSHSEIQGSKVICTYPRLFAAYHVLLRL